MRALLLCTLVLGFFYLQTKGEMEYPFDHLLLTTMLIAVSYPMIEQIHEGVRRLRSLREEKHGNRHSDQSSARPD